MSKLKAKVFNRSSALELENSINVFLMDEEVNVEQIAYSTTRQLPPESQSELPALEYHYCILLYRKR